MTAIHEVLFPLDIALNSAGGPQRRTDVVTLCSGDGMTASFGLIMTYGGLLAPYRRRIDKPVTGSVRGAVAGVEQSGSAFTVDAATGVVTFLAGHIPGAGQGVTAGFMFDVPVRFDA